MSYIVNGKVKAAIAEGHFSTRTFSTLCLLYCIYSLKEVLSWISQSHTKHAESWIKLSYAGTNVSGVLEVITKVAKRG